MVQNPRVLEKVLVEGKEGILGILGFLSISWSSIVKERILQRHSSPTP